MTVLCEAEFYAKRGISVIAIAAGSKAPPQGFPWTRYAERQPTADELRRWFASGNDRNLAGVMGTVSGLIALDADTTAKATVLASKLPPTDMRTRTPKGMHYFYRIGPHQTVPTFIRVGGQPLDLKAERSYVLLAPSLHPCGTRYERLGTWDPERVPFFDLTWIDEITEAPVKRPITRSKVTAVRAYLARIHSIQGQKGSAGLVRACAVLRDAGVSQAEAMVYLIEWNNGPTVSPPWSLAELSRAVTRTYAKGKANV